MRIRKCGLILACVEWLIPQMALESRLNNTNDCLYHVFNSFEFCFTF